MLISHADGLNRSASSSSVVRCSPRRKARRPTAKLPRSSASSLLNDFSINVTELRSSVVVPKPPKMPQYVPLLLPPRCVRSIPPSLLMSTLCFRQIRMNTLNFSLNASLKHESRRQSYASDEPVLCESRSPDRKYKWSV